MKVAIHQPQYWPWPPYIHKIMSADIFVYLDTVQFSKNGLQNRNQIKSRQGALWLTLPVRQERGQSLAATHVADRRALEKHWKTVVANYARTPGFKRWESELHALFHGSTDLLCDTALASTEWMLEKLGVKTKRVKASSLSGIEGKASMLVASICESLGATEYLTGRGALGYMNADDFARAGCTVLVQEWIPLEYKQAHMEAGFVPDLSTLDLLLNCPDEAAQLIASAGSWRAI